MNIESIRLQLMAVANSAENIDEAYAMQNYLSKFWDIYEQCRVERAYREAIKLIHLCITNDCAMPTSVRQFVNSINRIIHSASALNIAQYLSTLIPSNGTFGELIKTTRTLFDFKWILLFGLFNDQTKQLMIRLINNDYQGLIDLHLTYLNNQHQSNSIQRSLLQSVKNANHLWSTLDRKQKGDLLSPLFADDDDFVQIIQGLSEKKPADLYHLISVTYIILKRFNVPQTWLNQITHIFQRTTSSDISDTLFTYFTMTFQQREALASQIYRFKTPLVAYNGNQPIEKRYLTRYCDIIQQLVTLNATQWNSAKKSISAIGDLLCDINDKRSIVNTIISHCLRLLDILNPDKNWSTIRECYVQFDLSPSWETMSDFIDKIPCHKDIIRLTRRFRNADDEQTIAETIFELCRFILTKDNLNLLDRYQISIRNLQPTTKSPIEILKMAEPFVPLEIKDQLNAYLTLLRLSPGSFTDLNDYDQYLLFDNIVSSWLKLFNITSPKLRHLFEAISSILTSFPGLVAVRGNPLCQQLFTTSLASAFCTLANCRQNTREGYDDTSSSTISTTSPLSILGTIRLNLQQNTLSSEMTRSINYMSTPTTPSPPAQTTAIATLCPYSEEILTKMQLSVTNYLRNSARQSAYFDESGKIRDIINVTLDYHPQVARWYAIFATFNVLMHYRSNANDSNDGHQIVQNGLQLLRDIIVAKKILEPAFAYTGVRFLVKSLNQLEKCFLSLALENCPLLLNTLRQLNIDTSQLKQDFKLPSRSIGSNKGTKKKTRLELIQDIGTKSDSNEQNQTSESTMINSDHLPLTMEDWQNAMKKNNDQKVEDLLKLARHRPKTQSKQGKITKSGNNTETKVKKLASTMLAEYSNKEKVTPISTHNLPDEDIDESRPLDIDFQMKAMQEHLKKQPNLIEMYEKSNTKVASTTFSDKLDNRASLKLTTKPDQWTYQLLVEIPPITRMIDTIVQQFRLNWDKLTDSMNITDRHEIRWCIMIDNSGSMSIHRTVIYETLIVILELLRKLESKFAVARFGTRKNQKLLKNFNELFTNQDGQYVLEALTFDEGTYPATGLARVANQVFPVGPDTTNENIHQLVLMITDGLTEERDDASYSQTITKHNINLGFMFIEKTGQSTSQVLLRGLKQAQHCILNADNIKELPIKVPELMYQMIKACLTRARRSTALRSPFPLINIKMPHQINESPSEKPSYKAENPTSYAISSPTSAIPKLAEVHSQLNDYLSRLDDYTDYASQAIDDLRKYYQQLEITSKMYEMEKNWIGDEYRFSNLIDDLTLVLGDLVFPLNKFTRRRAALRGSSLYLPGLIKAMTTEWNYKKIFSAKLAGGKREHAICLVIDVSPSMFGSLSSGMIDGIIVLMGALRKLNLDNCGIIIFGRDVRLIKTNEQLWDTGSIVTLINELRFDRDDDTRDADAIEVAIDFLKQCYVRGEKKIFILTDGYTNCGNHLSMVQQRAEDNGIDLIAMAIGIDQTNLKSVYKRYLQCTTPYGLPKAIGALFQNEIQLFSFDRSSIKDISNVSNTISIDTLFNEIQTKKIFGEMIKDLAGQRDLILVNSGQPPKNITIDICFCLDCTGSMSRWLTAAKEQMKTIIDEIPKLINKEYPSLNLNLRFAIVAYRDIHDKPMFRIQDFTDNPTEVTNFLSRITAGGGDDIPEDVLAALDQCLNLNWSKTNAKFIVLITDAPGHGPELNDNLLIDKHPKGNDKHTVKSICDRLLAEEKEIDFMFCRIKPEATAKMQAAFTQFYNAKKEKTGRALTPIDLFDRNQTETESIHFVFVLDESGSMESHWSSLETAYQGFLARRNDDQGGNDHCTVVLFDSNARIISEHQRLSNTPKDLPNLNKGGTVYSEGLTLAQKTIIRHRTKSSIVMIFMSDGGNNGGDNPVALIEGLKRDYGENHNFICYTVAFGDAADPGSPAAQLLHSMATAGGGQRYLAKNGIELRNVFNKIAVNSTTSDALVARFSDILAREITAKIMVDYL